MITLPLDLKAIQLRNEYTYDKSHLVEHMRATLEADFTDEMAFYLRKLKEFYSTTDFTYVTADNTVKEWTTKKERFLEINNELDVEELAWDCLIHAVCKPTTSMTEIVGKIYNKFKHNTARQNLESASEFVAVLGLTRFIEIVKPKNTEEGVIMITSNVTLDKEVNKYLRGLRYTLPSLVPLQPVTSNNDIGYMSVKGSLILGGRHHDIPLPYGHINRMNSIPMSINTRLFQLSTPVFKDKYGETELKKAQRKESFIQCNIESADIYANLVKAGNKFYLAHQYCSRGRTYAHGYHVNVQGDNFRKGVLELHNKEIVRMD